MAGFIFLLCVFQKNANYTLDENKWTIDNEN
ncbi:hypothetical protein HD_0625 [[Haemophilus] ducreyi 35000HP]|uniref:Uncharacterized protein n=1 Tax=Haemophilus ducreyi (strain 35000HP / ATCC 700724) TaxID=233412 RepID=Q7VNC8_HAEDU|nr:hypothetical protein HD_0625 [[Haemophilus] ducreyi 35000HP]